MKLAVMSDLHLSVAPFVPPSTDADLIVLAGDIARPDAAMAWARGLGKPVLYVPGNHEFYGGTLAGTVRRLKELASGSSVVVLDNEVVVIDGVRFVGSTLWTDFATYAEYVDDEVRRASERAALAIVRDFSRIRSADDSDALFSPVTCAEQFARNSAWLASVLDRPFDGPSVVITHHAPSLRSIHPRFAGSPINACFVSDAEGLMGRERVDLWIHGHTHDSFDYVVRGTRVVCNPRGYRQGGVDENPAFRPELVIELPRVPAREADSRGARVAGKKPSKRLAP